MSLTLQAFALVSGIILGTSWPLPVALLFPFGLMLGRGRVIFVLILIVGLGQGMAIHSVWTRYKSLDGHQAIVTATITEKTERPIGTNVRLGIYQVNGSRVGIGGVSAWLTLRTSLERGASVAIRCGEWVVTERPSALALQTPSVRCASPQVVTKRPPSLAIRWLELARQRFIRALEAALPEPAASLATGLTLGDTTTLPPAVVENFRATGTSHILALSGYNVTILVAVLLAWLPALVGKRFAFLIIGVTLVLFLVLTGMPPSLLRATAMAGLLLLARWVGRRATADRSLSLTLIMLLGLAPVLVFDLGFVLSVASTAGLIAFGNRIVHRLPGPLMLRQTFGTTLAAIAATLPLIVSVFGRVSVVAPLANLVVLPLVPVLFFGSAIVGGIAVVAPGLAAILAVSVNWGSQIFLKTIAWFAHWPAASITVHVPNLLPWIVPIIFLGLTLRYRPRACQKCACPERSTYV